MKTSPPGQKTERQSEGDESESARTRTRTRERESERKRVMKHGRAFDPKRQFRSVIVDPTGLLGDSYYVPHLNQMCQVPSRYPYGGTSQRPR